MDSAEKRGDKVNHVVEEGQVGGDVPAGPQPISNMGHPPAMIRPDQRERMRDPYGLLSTSRERRSYRMRSSHEKPVARLCWSCAMMAFFRSALILSMFCWRGRDALLPVAPIID